MACAQQPKSPEAQVPAMWYPLVVAEVQLLLLGLVLWMSGYPELLHLKVLNSLCLQQRPMAKQEM
jgi:hypothetical protein